MYKIEKNTVQETLIIPLIGRKVCSEHFPELFKDPEAERICSMIDYDFEEKCKKMETKTGLHGALEVAQRQYGLAWEVKDYLKKHPSAAVVNLGCGLDDTFRRCDNGTCKGYNIDMQDVIEIRNELLPPAEREQNMVADLNDEAWMDKIDASDGAIFFAAGVFYYFKTEDIKTMLQKMAKKFPGGVVVFDSCNKRGVRMMSKTWLEEADMGEVNVYFSVEDKSEIEAWSDDFESVTARSYMRGYRDIFKDMNLLHKFLIMFCDIAVKMKIMRVEFKK